MEPTLKINDRVLVVKDTIVELDTDRAKKNCAKSGLTKETIDKIHYENSDQDFFSAIKICKKKKIGPARTEDNRPIFFKKDISLLARNGFDFETSKKVMNLDKKDYLQLKKKPPYSGGFLIYLKFKFNLDYMI